MKQIIFCSIFLLSLQNGYSQLESQLENLIESQVEGNEQEIESAYEKLYEIIENPLIFRYLTKKKLSVIPFISEFQVEVLLSLRDTAKQNPTWERIFDLAEFSPEQEAILPLIIILQESAGPYDKFRQIPRVNIISTYWQNIEKAVGYYNSEGAPVFIGRPGGTRIRGQVSGRDYSFKAIAESDPGEMGIKMPDHRSAGILVEPERQSIKILFGDYHLALGLGLGLASRSIFRSWKAEPHLQLPRLKGFSLHGGSDENRFLRGGAIAYSYKNFTGRAFFSAKDLDVTLKSIGDHDAYISGVYASGLHRTTSEMEKKDAVFEEIGGLELDYSGSKLEVGALLAAFSFSNRFKIPEQYGGFGEDREFPNEAKRYSIWFRRLVGTGIVLGELAGSDTGGSALSLSYSSFYDKGLAYLVSYERIETSFFSHYTHVSSSIVNSKGSQSGKINLFYQAGRKWGIQTEFGLQGAMSPALESTSGSDLYMKCRMSYNLVYCTGEVLTQIKPGHISGSMKIKSPIKENKLSWQGELGISSDSIAGIFKNPGTFISLRTKYSGGDGMFNIQGGFSLFTNQAGSGPFYIYEPDVLYGMSLPALSGLGSRAFLLLQYNFLKYFRIEAKLTRLAYDDRKSIGAGNDEVLSSMKTGVKVQVVYRGSY